MERWLAPRRVAGPNPGVGLAEVESDAHPERVLVAQAHDVRVEHGVQALGQLRGRNRGQSLVLLNQGHGRGVLGRVLRGQHGRAEHEPDEDGDGTKPARPRREMDGRHHGTLLG